MPHTGPLARFAAQDHSPSGIRGGKSITLDQVANDRKSDLSRCSPCDAQEALGELSCTSAFLASSLDASDNR
jgi:hypothetical protein